VARLDKLIQLLHEQRADALRLSAGEPAALQQNGAARPLTREALTDAQITALVREIAPPAVAPQVGTGAALAFGYAAPSGAVEAELSSSPAPAGG
jgi:Tfp pilus assembly ATPase PilU